MIVDGAVDRATSELDGRVPILVEAGYQGFWAAETNESVAVTLQRVAMLGSSDHDLFASTAIAFARSPMTLAYDFATLKAGSAGVVRLGIGSQIRQHIRKRFGMPWYNPISPDGGTTYKLFERYGTRGLLAARCNTGVSSIDLC